MALNDFDSPADSRATPEAAPSELATEEPTFPRTAGTIGLLLVIVGVLALFLNRDRERLIGPTLAAIMSVIGVAAMLYHAARDKDVTIRKAYLGVGFGLLAVGAVLSLVPKSSAGEAFGPWLATFGVMGLLAGFVFLLAAGRHETEGAWHSLVANVLGLGGLCMGIAGLIGAGWSIETLPRFTTIALLGLIFSWGAVGQFGPTCERGYRLGQILGLLGLAALLAGILGTLIPWLMHATGLTGQEPTRFFMPRGFVLSGLGVLFLLLAFGLCSDQPIVAMTRRELSAYFCSPIAYLVLFGTALIGWLNYNQMIDYVMERTRNATDTMREPIISFYAANIFTAFGVMFIIPAITMRLLSEERRTGTIEVLLTADVTEWQVVLSKFFAALIFLMALTVPWAVFLIPLFLLSRTGFDYFPLLSFYLAVVCTGAAFVAMGLFFSGLTRNQIIAAVLTFAGMFLFLAALFLQEKAEATWRAVFEQLSFFDVWIGALTGKLLVHKLITFVSIAIFWLFLTTKVLEARKWS